MSMGQQQSMSMGQSMETTQTVSQRMIQTMEYLQLQEQQLQEKIAEELEKNPVLELDETANSRDEEESDQKDPVLEQDGVNRADKSEKQDKDIFDIDDYFETHADNQYDEDRPTRSRNALDNESEHYLDFYQNIPAPGETLQDHLLEQLRWFDYPENIRQYTEELIYHLDPAGYLRPRDPESGSKVSADTASKTAVDNSSKEGRSEYLRQVLRKAFAKNADGEEREIPDAEWSNIEKALYVLQTLDPPGIGARDLQECLLLQITDQMPDAEQLRILVMDHLDDLEKNRFPQIARQMNISIEEVQTLLTHLRRLNPKPGLDYNSEQAAPILPDVYVEKKEGNWEVRTADGLSTQLRINAEYQNMASQKKTDVKTKKYLRERISSARWLLEMVEQRKRTLLSVAREIIDYQRAFLDEGPSKIRPLTLQTIADKLGINSSTVSRACSNKWLQSPQGLFPFKRFFSGAVPSSGQNEDGLAQEAVFTKLQEYINNEDKKNPLSDDELEKMFEKDNIKVCRRTIAKYRNILKIPNSRERRSW